MNRGLYAFLLATLLLAACRSDPPDATRAVVLRVTDGDSFVVRLPAGEETAVRAIGIDAPEASENAKLRRQTEGEDERAAVVAMGRAAAEHARTLLPVGAELELGFDPVNAPTGHRDRFGRLLAYVYILEEEEEDPVFFNQRMIADGYAAVMSGFPFDESIRRDLRRAFRDARGAGRGLWKDGRVPFD